MESLTGHSSPAFRFIATTLPGWPDVSVLCAAARAGATAVLNLEGVPHARVRPALSALTRHKPGLVGVRVVTADDLDCVWDLVDALDVVVIATGALAATLVLVDRLRDRSCDLFVECTTADEARAAGEAGATAVVAKGHESGGRVGDETTFVLAQRLLAETRLPVYAHGGIGRHTVGACRVAGCAGAVLDVQLALARESTLPSTVKNVLSRMEGDETVCLGADLEARYRVYRRPGFVAVDELQRLELELATRATAAPDARERWRQAIQCRINWSGVGLPLWPLGQDAAFAAQLATRFRSVSGILAGLADALTEHVTAARELKPLDRGAPLALAHRTEYPILQGPMTRVSDTAKFADAVAKGGALPFLALALLRGPQVRALLAATKQVLGDRSWGVGILGFVPNALREEQLRVIEEFAPPFALIAGGRPDQAAKLEKHGIPTYLHVPAPSLLQMFVADGARRFVFEGRECGGHVGPRTSFVLWEAMVDTLVEAIDRGVPASEFHIVFAGGIHDARSAAMVATIGAPLATRGARIGVLMGTAYLFTDEAVATGAIVEGFQREAVKCTRTVLLESGPGHATRCADTPFFDVFRETRRRFLDEGQSLDDVRLKLETLNLGRLRVASKGVAHATDVAHHQAYVSVDPEQQRTEGMFMIGQVAALRHATCGIADLHAAVSVDGTRLLDRTDIGVSVAAPEVPATALSANIAIVGVGCLLPHALDARTLWKRILDKADAIGEIPADRFDAARYFDPDRRARDKIYSKWGGFLGEIPFDPLKYGIPPTAVPSIDPFQLLTLEVVHQALADAGYADRPFDRERTSVILGASGGAGDLGFRYGIRAGLPMYFDSVSDATLANLPEWTEDSFAGVLLNVAAGRVANRLNLGGLNFTVDAACASSLAAVYVAARELEAGASNMVIVGGIDTVNSPFGYLCFSSAQALSPTGRCRTFDEAADGIAISEGLVTLVLKRVVDAERDGDRIYAVIRAVAGSSDGRGKGLTAPRPEGQMRVLQRAYEAAGFSPATVGLVEAHGTGTVAGDTAEVTALSAVFGKAGATPASCALGSIKSMIGHTKSAAGVSGLLKVALALHRKVLPPTLHVTTPNARLREPATPFFVNTDAQPWVAPVNSEQPRRAAVSSFGFGGTNFHVVVEEYAGDGSDAFVETAPVDEWPSELTYWTAASVHHLDIALQEFDERLSRNPDVPLRSVAAAVCRSTIAAPARPLRLAIVASSTGDLRTKVAEVRKALTEGVTQMSDARGIYLSEVREPAGKVSFLFPGQGSQYPGMHRELATYFPDVRHAVELADRVTAGDVPARRLSSFIFPPPAFSEEDQARQLLELTDTTVAQPALGAVERGACDLLERFGIRPDMTAGHSYGEYVALSAAGAFSPEVLFELSAARGRAIKAAAAGEPGTMAAVSASPDDVAPVLEGTTDVWVANVNSPRQTVLAGRTPDVDAAVAKLSAAGLAARRIPVACAFHSPLVETAARTFRDVLERANISEPRIPVFSNTLGDAYPADTHELRRILAEHIIAPVLFADELEAMYRAGGRFFIEVGPRTVLANLARETLSGRDATILCIDSRERHGVTQFLHVLGQLAALGVPVDFDELWRGRTIETIQLAQLTTPEPLPRHVWMVSGGRARRQDEKASVPIPQAAAPIAVPVVETTNAPPIPSPLVHVSTSRIGHPQGGRMQSDATNPTPPFPVGAASHDVMRQFQQLMSQFLQTQAIVMTTYLQGAPAAAMSTLPAAAPLGYTPRQDLASQPIQHEDTRWQAPAAQSTPVAPVVTVAPPSALPPPSVGPTAPAVAAAALPTPAAAPAVPAARASGNGSAPDVLSQLLGIVSDRTGYPQEMLDADANIEADLGIDSIKRMEILTAFQQMHAGTQRGSFQGAMEKLTAIKTLRDTATVLADLLVTQPEQAVA